MNNWLTIKAKAENSIDEIYVYGEIGDWWQDLDAKALADRLKNSNGDTINLRINSGGGEVFTATAFYSLLKSSNKTINVYIDGLAASAATLIACAGDKVIMPVNALYMIHNPLSWTYGNSENMREMADLLDTVRDTLVATYKQKTGLDDAKIIELMDNETWLTASEALKLGFVDEIMDTAVAANTNKVVEMSNQRLKNIPKTFENAVKSANEQPKKVVNPMDLAKFKAEHSAIAEQFKAEITASHKTEVENAVKAERQRIVDIQDAALQGQDELVKDAIENGLSAGEFAIKAMKQTKEKGSEFLNNRDNDTAVINKVTPSNTVVDTNKQPETAEDKLVAALDQAFEVK